MLLFATQIMQVVLRVMFSSELSLRNLACCGCCHHAHLHCCVKTQQTTDQKGSLLSVIWGKQLPPCLLLEVQDLSLDYRWWVCVAWVGVASEIWNYCAFSARCLLWQMAFAWLSTRPSGPLCWCNGRVVLLNWERVVWGRERPCPCTAYLSPQCSPEPEQTLQPCPLTKINTDSKFYLEILSWINQELCFCSNTFFVAL